MGRCWNFCGSACAAAFLFGATAAFGDLPYDNLQGPAVGTRMVIEGFVNNPSHDGNDKDTQNSAAVLALGKGKMVAVYADTGALNTHASHRIGYAYSINNGKTWTDIRNLPASPFYEWGYPSLVRHPENGEAYLAIMAINPQLGQSGIPVYRSADGGRTWKQPADAAAGAVVAVFPRITVDNHEGKGKGNIYACFTDNAANLRVTRSIDAGASFIPAGGVEVAPSGGFCSMVVTPDHVLHVAYVNFAIGGSASLAYVRSKDRGKTFSSPVPLTTLKNIDGGGTLVLADGLKIESFPQIAANPDGNGKKLYVVYNDDATPTNAGDDNANIYMIRSADGGKTWSAPFTVDTSAGDQFNPAIAFGKEGHLMVGYYSRSHDPDNQQFHRRGRMGQLKSSGAVKFYPSFQLGPNTPVVINDDPEANTDRMGYTDQMSASGGYYLDIWSDNRIAGVASPRQPDIQFARIKAAPPKTDLKATLKLSAPLMQNGDKGLATLTVTSTTGTANDVFVTLRPEFGLRIENGSGGDCTRDNEFFTCSLGSIGAGKSKSVYASLTMLSSSDRKLDAFISTSSRDTKSSNNKLSKTIQGLATLDEIDIYENGTLTAIPDSGGGSVDIPIEVTDAGEIQNVIVQVRLSHTYIDDLKLELISPDGVKILLSDRNGGSNDDYGSGNNNCTGSPMTFSDGGAQFIQDAIPPLTGIYKPEGLPLSEYDRGFMGGTWRLRVTDLAGGDVGTVGCARLVITH